MNISYIIARFTSLFSRDRHEAMSSFFRKKGITVGNYCNILSDISVTEPYLVSIGDNTTISSDVVLLTHDASVGKIFGKEVGSDVFGRISIGSNCFIGARSTILYGVNLADNIIVASGSVVTKSFTDEYIIIGGNPARIIGNWDNLREKTKDKVYSVHGKKGKSIREIIECNPERLIVK